MYRARDTTRVGTCNRPLDRYPFHGSESPCAATLSEMIAGMGVDIWVGIADWTRAIATRWGMIYLLA